MLDGSISDGCHAWRLSLHLMLARVQLDDIAVFQYVIFADALSLEAS